MPIGLRLKMPCTTQESTKFSLAARALPDTINIAALVGHNPGMTYAANSFAENLELDNLPTCGIVGIEFPVSTWREIDTGSLHYFDYPKNADGPLLGSQA